MNKILVIENSIRTSRTGPVLKELNLPLFDHIIGLSQKHPVDGVLYAIDIHRRLKEITLREYALALVDGSVHGSVRIPDIIQVLQSYGILCVGISNMYYDVLKHCGAIVSKERRQIYEFLRTELPGIYEDACRQKLEHSRSVA